MESELIAKQQLSQLQNLNYLLSNIMHTQRILMLSVALEKDFIFESDREAREIARKSVQRSLSALLSDYAMEIEKEKLKS